MFKMCLRYIALAVSATVLSSCIKENRIACPCLLTVDCSSFREHIGSVVAFGWNSEGVEYSDTCMFVSDTSGILVNEVKRNPLISTVLGGLNNTVWMGEQLIIPKGQCFDPLVAFSERISCDKDEAVSIAIPQKHYARIRLNIEGGAGNSAYHFKFLSDVAGISLINLMPLTGVFEYTLIPSTDERCYIDIPRQIPDTDALKMQAVRDGKTEVTVNLSALLEERGYDWSSVNLDDITVDFNHSRADVSVRINEWNEGNCLEIRY